MTQPHVAVVIVTYRTAALSIEALRSVAQERETIQVRIRAVVVDNASGDLPAIESAVGANGWASWVTLTTAPRNGGFAYGNNLGIERLWSDGAPDYVYLLNPDAEVRPGAIRELVSFLEMHPAVGIAGSSFENRDGSIWPIAFRFPTAWSELNGGLSLAAVSRLLRAWVVPRQMGTGPEQVDWICGASMLIRPAVLRTIGCLDENYFLYFEETDFCWRARQAGFTTWYVPASRVMHIRGQSTTVTDLEKPPARLPPYWFASRRRYFAVTHGPRRAMLIDVIALAAGALGLVKLWVQGRRHRAIPHYLRDLVRNSLLWPANRNLAPVRTYTPPRISRSS